MTFDEIFREYYTLYRGQASNIPAFGDREYTLAIHLANAGIKKWERADGILWKELFTTLDSYTPEDGETLVTTLADGTVSYAAPRDMRKPPGFVIVNGHTIKTIPSDEREQYDDDRTIWFTGSAQGGYTMHVTAAFATANTGNTLSYTYYKKATLLSTTVSPAAVVPEMSDPTFLIQDMLATRAQQARNGFVFKAAKAESTAALANMKIENYSGTPGNTQNFSNSGGSWGTSSFGSIANDIRL